jgi:hypothetical protein
MCRNSESPRPAGKVGRGDPGVGCCSAVGRIPGQPGVTADARRPKRGHGYDGSSQVTIARTVPETKPVTAAQARATRSRRDRRLRDMGPPQVG